MHKQLWWNRIVQSTTAYIAVNSSQSNPRTKDSKKNYVCLNSFRLVINKKQPYRHLHLLESKRQRNFAQKVYFQTWYTLNPFLSADRNIYFSVSRFIQKYVTRDKCTPVTERCQQEFCRKRLFQLRKNTSC